MPGPRVFRASKVSAVILARKVIQAAKAQRVMSDPRDLLEIPDLLGR